MAEVEREHCEVHNATYILRSDDNGCPRCERDRLRVELNTANERIAELTNDLADETPVERPGRPPGVRGKG